MNAIVYTSLFEEVRYLLGDTVALMHCTKATLTHLSHTLEDVVLTHRLPALMFTGFQESTHWREETQRYQELANIAQQVCIFAGKPLAQGLPTQVMQIELRDEDPLRQEWFVVILSESFSVLLCGKDTNPIPYDDGLRQFETILSFSPQVINRVLDHLAVILQQYRPELLPKLAESRQQYPMPASNLDLVTLVMNQMVQYEEQLIQQVRAAEALRRTEERLRLELEKERELSDIRHILLTTISHEFRTPLTMMQSSSEMLERYFDTLSVESRQKRLATIKTQVQQLRLLLDDVDTILAADRGNLVFQPEALNPVDLCQELVTTFAEVILTQHRIKFTYVWTQGMVLADERLLRLILTNLLSNAAKFSPNQAWVELELAETPGQMIFYVRDQGIGIPENSQGRIYEAFYRGNNVGSIGGTGLGLKIVHDCITLHQGTIRFTTSEHGTTFIVVLPAAHSQSIPKPLPA